MFQRANNTKIDELKIRTKHLRSELSDLLAKWFYLKNVVYPQIEYKYQQLFGELENEIDYYKAEITKKRKNQHPNSFQYSNSYQTKLDELNNAAEKIFSNIENSSECSKVPNYQLNVDYEISNLYRQLVKKLHPDTSQDIELFNKYWVNVQDAYHSKNLYKLRLFHKIICFDEYLDLITTRNHERVLSFELSELEKSIRIEKEKINRLMIKEPFIFMNKLDNNIWIQDRTNYLSRKLTTIKERSKIIGNFSSSPSMN